MPNGGAEQKFPFSGFTIEFVRFLPLHHMIRKIDLFIEFICFSILITSFSSGLQLQSEQKNNEWIKLSEFHNHVQITIIQMEGLSNSVQCFVKNTHKCPISRKYLNNRLKKDQQIEKNKSHNRYITKLLTTEVSQHFSKVEKS